MVLWLCRGWAKWILAHLPLSLEFFLEISCKSSIKKWKNRAQDSAVIILVRNIITVRIPKLDWQIWIAGVPRHLAEASINYTCLDDDKTIISSNYVYSFANKCLVHSQKYHLCSKAKVKI